MLYSRQPQPGSQQVVRTTFLVFRPPYSSSPTVPVWGETQHGLQQFSACRAAWAQQFCSLRACAATAAAAAAASVPRVEHRPIPAQLRRQLQPFRNALFRPLTPRLLIPAPHEQPERFLPATPPMQPLLFANAPLPTAALPPVHVQPRHPPEPERVPPDPQKPQAMLTTPIHKYK